MSIYGETGGRRGVAWRGIAGAAALALLAAAPARAQAINYTIYGGAAIDGYDTNIILLGATVRPTGNGFRPMAGVQAYRLGYNPDGPGSVDVLAVNPSIGGCYCTPDGQVSAMVGYAFVNEEAPLVIGGGSGQSGVTTALQGLYWGGDPDVEAIAAYSWEPEYLWTNLVVVQPIMSLRSGTLSVGGDGVWEGIIGDGGDYRAFSIGPAVRWSNDRNLGVTLAGGYRDARELDGTWYVRIGAAYYR